MNEISRINVDGVIYLIKDKDARNILTNLLNRLGDLAYENHAVGEYTPTGVISTPTISAVTNNVNINNIENVGSLPTFNSTVEDETLFFNFNEGTLPVVNQISVIQSIESVTASTPTFSGNTSTITVYKENNDG